jgi:uncharacterized protein (TIGR04255 family)
LLSVIAAEKVMPTYKNAPIVEALIQLQFEEGLSDRDIERTATRASAFYHSNEELQDFNVQVKVGHGSAIPSVIGEKKWRKLNSKDGADVLVVYKNHLTVGRLAPYEGWEKFFARFQRDNDIVHKAIGYKKVSRIGVRFINRIDIPLVQGNKTDISEYLNVFPHTPHIAPAKMRGIHTRFEYIEDSVGAIVIVTVAAVDPVLINHESYLLDIDIVKMHDISANRKEVVEQVASLREIKNSMFETLVTDAAKKRFTK